MAASPRFLPYWTGRQHGAEATVFCLPHAGGGASTYHRWVGADPALDVQPVQLPGREDLIGMAPVPDAERLVPMLGAQIADASVGRTVLFGHSMGAVLAAELTAWLHRHNAPVPALLVVSSRRGGAPRRPAAGQLTAHSSDEELVAGLLRMGGTHREVLEDPQLRALFLPTVRNDLLLLDRYRRGYGDRELPVPLLVCAGRDDTVSPDELADWATHTALECRVRTFPGGHFYLREQRRDLFRAVHEALGTTGLPSPAPSRKEHHAADAADAAR
ncbi:thioesterase II family protein [Streptomyces sp. CA-250714]|uniref:thioesterase II family protein n=1 Tax=Streptomyces sp. CA-250714 TaxID=3240060 RepID=UPI003D8F8B64